VVGWFEVWNLGFWDLGFSSLLLNGDDMKKTKTNDDDMLPEYDFSGVKGVRGKYYKRMQQGYTIKIHKADGSTVVKEIPPRVGTITLEPDVRQYFPDSESVNQTLRSLITLISNRTKSASKVKNKRELLAKGRSKRAQRL